MACGCAHAYGSADLIFPFVERGNASPLFHRERDPTFPMVVNVGTLEEEHVANGS